MVEEKHANEGRSFAETPTWAVATVITIMVLLGFFFHECLKQFGKVISIADLFLNFFSLVWICVFDLI